MSSSDRPRLDPAATRQEASSAASATARPDRGDPYADWVERMQRARARHAAITRNLYTWSSYKSWADRMKDSWQEDEKDK